MNFLEKILGKFKRTKYKYTGYFNIFVFDKGNGQLKRKERVNNLITNSCLNNLANSLINISPNLAINILAIGDDNTAPVATNTTLNNEVFRTNYISRSLTGTGEVTSEFYILDADYSGDIEEIGIFAGSSADVDTADSGTLMSHALWSYTKSSSEEIFIERVDTIS